MEKEQIKLLETLAAGIDPATGEAFGAGSPYQRPEVIRALYGALAELRNGANGAGNGNGAAGHQGPPRAGKPWTDEEEQRLLARFDAGESEADIARRLERTPGAVTARLVKLGRIEPPPGFRLRESA